MKDEALTETSEDDETNEHADHINVLLHDVLTDYVGEFGRYQIFYTLHKSWSTCMACMYTLVTVFLAAVPEHRCDFTGSLPNCTDEQVIKVFIPTEKRHGKLLPSQCQYYNFSQLSDHLNTSVESIGQCPDKNVSGILPLVNCDEWKYDTTFYQSTIINEVIIFSLIFGSLTFKALMPI